MNKFLTLGLALFVMTAVGCTQPQTTGTTTGTTTTTTTTTTTKSPAASPAATTAASPAATTAASPAAGTPNKAAAATPKADKVQDNGDQLYTDDDADLQFTVPKGWTAESGEYGWTVSTPDKELTTVLIIPEEGTIDDVVKATAKNLDKIMTNVKVNGEPKKDKANGMDTTSLGGEGEIKGTKVAWSMDIVSAKIPVIFVTFATPQAIEKHADQAQQFFGSIKRQEGN